MQGYAGFYEIPVTSGGCARVYTFFPRRLKWRTLQTLHTQDNYTQYGTLCLLVAQYGEI